MMVRVLSPQLWFAFDCLNQGFLKNIEYVSTSFSIFNIITKKLYSHPAKSIFKFLINSTPYTFFWSTLLTTKGVGLGYINPSFFLKLLKIIFTLDPPFKNTSLTPSFPTRTWITSMASSKSSILVVVTLQTLAIWSSSIFSNDFVIVYLN